MSDTLSEVIQIVQNQVGKVYESVRAYETEGYIKVVNEEDLLEGLTTRANWYMSECWPERVECTSIQLVELTPGQERELLFVWNFKNNRRGKLHDKILQKTIQETK